MYCGADIMGKEVIIITTIIAVLIDDVGGR